MKNKDLYDLKKLKVHIGGSSKMSLSYEGKHITELRNTNTSRERCILKWLEQDYSPLDDKEKEYLSAVIKPWRSKVKFIKKLETCDGEYQFIYIRYIDTDGTFEELNFPLFEPNTMYKGMELDREYTLEDLKI